MPLAAPDLGRLEDAIADGSEFRIRPLPALMEGGRRWWVVEVADEASLRGNGAYPSGHTSIGWAWGLVLAEARHNGARLPLTALVDQFYGDVQKMGGGRWDTSSLIKRLRD